MLNVISISDKCRLTKLNSEDVEWRGGVINPSDIGDVADFGYSIYALGFRAPKDYKIIWHSNILALSVHDGVSQFNRNMSCCIPNYSVLSVPDKGYSRNVPDKGYSRNVPDKGYSRNALSALNLISTFSFQCLWSSFILTYL
jgi:hypothetical protein